MMLAFHDGMTLAQAQDLLNEHIREGASCPVCSQNVKLYRRKLSSGIASALLLLYRNAGSDWQHLPSVVSRDLEPTKLAYWGLIEEDDRKREDGGRAGYWRVTLAGVQFAGGALRVPRYALVYNGRCFGLEGESVSISEALGASFDYAELMAA